MRWFCRFPPRGGARRGAAALFCLCLLLFGHARRAAAQPAPAPDSQRVRADLESIFRGSEFSGRSPQESPFTRAIEWIRTKVIRLFRALDRLFGRIFGGASGVFGGSGGVQWILLGLFFLVGAWVLARIILAFQRRATTRGARKSASTRALDEAELEHVTEPEIWLQQARRYAAAGDYLLAYRAVFIAILLLLDRQGAVRYDRARTNGDYVRALRNADTPQLYEALLPLAGDFDARWYGRRPTAEEDFQSCLAEYDRFRTLMPPAESTR